MTITFKMLEALVLLRTISWNLLSQFPNNVFNCENHRRIKVFSRLRVGLSHLCEHEFKHSFQDTLSPICNCSFDVEWTSHYILHSSMYTYEKHTLLSTIKNIDCRFLDVTETVFYLKIVLLIHTVIQRFLMQPLNIS